MLIINADDWGRSVEETDLILACYKQGRVTSTSAMVFMKDSERAAGVARANRLDTGLHLNFAERFTGEQVPARLQECQDKLVKFLMGKKYSQLLYNPRLRRDFSCSYQAQVDEFRHLYQSAPSHMDGHHHMHLCGNMLVGQFMPRGTKVRRNFSFWPGEKSKLNRAYRGLVDRWLSRRYRLTDYFFDLLQCKQEKKFERVSGLAKSSTVELMTHPIVREESVYLQGAEFGLFLKQLPIGSYAQL
jgi:predicted glycoside hydrolase/deacetylase ChbG (UPF0249 family)